jgi:hypothetical protein
MRTNVHAAGPDNETSILKPWHNNEGNNGNEIGKP